MNMNPERVAWSLCEQFERLHAERQSCGHTATAEELRLRGHLAFAAGRAHVVAKVVADPALPASDAAQLVRRCADAFGGWSSDDRGRLFTYYASRAENAHRIGHLVKVSNPAVAKRAWQDKLTPPVVRSWLAANIPLAYLTGREHPHWTPWVDSLTILRRFAAQNGSDDAKVDGTTVFAAIAYSWRAAARKLGEADAESDKASFAACVTAAIDLILDYPDTFTQHWFSDLLPHSEPAHRARQASRLFDRFTPTAPTRDVIVAVAGALPASRDGDFDDWVRTITDPLAARFAASNTPAIHQGRTSTSCQFALKSDTGGSNLAQALLACVGTDIHLWDLTASLIAASDIALADLVDVLSAATTNVTAVPLAHV